MSVTFTKLFSSITASTVWCEPDQTRIAWIAMLAMADRKGRVWGSIPGFASIARIPVDAARLAIATFLAPDEDSRTKEFEGRRIEEIDGGWRLLNYEKHRAIQDEESVLESKRRYINGRRAREREQMSTVDKRVESRGLEIQAEEEEEALKPKDVVRVLKAKTPKQNLAFDFDEFWKHYPRKVNKQLALRAYQKLNPDEALHNTMLRAIAKQRKSEQWQRNGGEFIPHASTWINARRWEDEATDLSAQASDDWSSTRSGVVSKGCRLGIGPWSEVDAHTGHGPTWQQYKASVINAANTNGVAP